MLCHTVKRNAKYFQLLASRVNLSGTQNMSMNVQLYVNYVNKNLIINQKKYLIPKNKTNIYKQPVIYTNTAN